MISVKYMPSSMSPEVNIKPDRPFSTIPGALPLALKQALAVTGISVLVLIPCFWQARIEAGDLSSHIYNAWLVVLIKRGSAPGLSIASQWTNVIFDYFLSALASSIGFAAAQRVAVSVSVVLFFWSTFAVVGAISGKRPWIWTPCLAMLTYGVMFYLGCFNYYIALALSFYSLVLLLKPTFGRIACALGLLVAAWLGQPLPPLWVLGTVAYIEVFRRIAPRYRLLQFVVGLFLLFSLRVVIMRHYVAIWSPKQFLYVTGADQVVIFGLHYRYIFLLLLVLWISLFIKLVRALGYKGTVQHLPCHLYALCVIGAFILPAGLFLPQYQAVFGDITQRLSLIAGVLACVVISGVKPTRLHLAWLGVMATAFFCQLYIDAASMNRLESAVENKVSELPPGQRVVGRFKYPQQHGLDISMILDRACIDKCFSYGNYEPSTLQFRVRAAPLNTIVAWNQKDPIAAQYSMSRRPEPLYEIYQCGNALTDLCIRSMPSGLSTLPTGM
jgi:hypothetical protein